MATDLKQGGDKSVQPERRLIPEAAVCIGPKRAVHGFALNTKVSRIFSLSDGFQGQGQRAVITEGKNM